MFFAKIHHSMPMLIDRSILRRSAYNTVNLCNSIVEFERPIPSKTSNRKKRNMLILKYARRNILHPKFWVRPVHPISMTAMLVIRYPSIQVHQKEPQKKSSRVPNLQAPFLTAEHDLLSSLSKLTLGIKRPRRTLHFHVGIRPYHYHL